MKNKDKDAQNYDLTQTEIAQKPDLASASDLAQAPFGYESTQSESEAQGTRPMNWESGEKINPVSDERRQKSSQKSSEEKPNGEAKPRQRKPEKLVSVKPIERAKHGEKKHSKRRRRRHPISMNLFFAIIIVAELILILGSSSGVLNVVRSTVDGAKILPDLLWLAVICVTAGIATVVFLIRFFSAPIFTLGNAVNKVADGDFSIRLNEKKGFSEIRRINSNFNKMVEELSATEILQTDFVSNVSHEFKTPITAIEGYATLLGGSEGTTPEQAEYIDKILFNTKRLSSLVGNILLLSKVDNQTIPNKKNTFRLDEQVRQALLSHESAWTEKDCELDVELDEVSYFGNEPLLFHVWSNLIGNAIKFGPECGKIIISLHEQNDLILFSVSDEGEGVSDEAKKHVFDRFYQTDSSHKSEGNGLGLALVKQILKLEGGEISVSDAEIGGAKFTVTLRGAPKQ